MADRAHAAFTHTSPCVAHNAEQRRRPRSGSARSRRPRCSDARLRSAAGCPRSRQQVGAGQAAGGPARGSALGMLRPAGQRLRHKESRAIPCQLSRHTRPRIAGCISRWTPRRATPLGWAAGLPLLVWQGDQRAPSPPAVPPTTCLPAPANGCFSWLQAPQAPPRCASACQTAPPTSVASWLPTRYRWVRPPAAQPAMPLPLPSPWLAAPWLPPFVHARPHPAQFANADPPQNRHQSGRRCPAPACSPAPAMRTLPL